MERNYSLEAMLTFCDEQIAANPGSPGRYKNWKTAARSVFSLLTEAQRADIRGIDIPTAVELYAGQHHPKPKTKQEYLGRLKVAVVSFLESMQGDEVQPVDGSVSKPSRIASDEAKPRIKEKVVSEANTFTVPIRKDFLAQFILPIDLTQDEAKRVCRLIEVLPLG